MWQVMQLDFAWGQIFGVDDSWELSMRVAPDFSGGIAE